MGFKRVGALRQGGAAMSATPRTDAHYAGQCFSQRDKDFAAILETELAATKSMLAMAEDAAMKGEEGRKLGTAYEGCMEELTASHAREVQLREALVVLREEVRMMPCGIDQPEFCDRALNLPPPPVVPLALADELASALRSLIIGGSLSDANAALEAWRTAK